MLYGSIFKYVQKRKGGKKNLAINKTLQKVKTFSNLEEFYFNFTCKLSLF